MSESSGGMMNLQTLQNNSRLQHKLAAEYVLGTLRGGARSRFEHWLRQDASLRQLVRQWEAHLLAMAELAPLSHPSPQVWEQIRQRIGDARKVTQSVSGRWQFWRELRNDLAFWRGLGLVSTTAAVILFSVMLNKQSERPERSPAQYVAALEDDKAQAIALITGDRSRRQLVVRMLNAPQIRADQSLELWSVSKEGKVRSLGLLASQGSATLPMPEHMISHEQALLAISLEPKGGSGNPDKPSGPILFKGQWLQL
ncbi:anti-sigma factor [Undibacterium oligocarboniphilum]|jgi:anti-sigma-K factor RskA|nr:anti-sigma factor [Undibacterium oligocarboniphilum]